MSCLFSCFAPRTSVKSVRLTTAFTAPSAEEVRVLQQECLENEKTFIEEYPTSRQAQESQKPPVRTAQQIREDFLKASEEFEKVEPPMVATETENRRKSTQEAGLVRAHSRATKATSKPSHSLPQDKFESQQVRIKTDGQTKLVQAAALAAKKKEQINDSKLRPATVGKGSRPERVMGDVRRVRSRSSRKGIETKVGQTLVQSAVPLTPATIRTIALYPDAWEATKALVDREGTPVKKITRKSSTFTMSPRSPLPPKAKSAESHSLKVDN